jgi:hypothetical protein
MIRDLLRRLRRHPFNCETQQGEKWLARAGIAADLVASVASGPISVADLGCGDQKMKAALEEAGLDVDYHGFDLMPQSDSVARLDIQHDPMPGPFDVALLLGVLEYIPEVDSVLRRVHRTAPMLVVSHLHGDDAYFTEALARRQKWRTVLERRRFETHLTEAGWSIVECRLTPDRLTIVWLCRAG